jgi:arginyl-tRNA synthetase
MIDIKQAIADLIAAEISQMTAEELRGLLEIPTDETLGDYALPCFRLAKTLRKAPPLIASDLADRLAGQKLFEKVEAVNGYLNMFIDRRGFLRETLGEVLKTGERFGASTVGEGKTVIVEFSSPNIARSFHIGHIRSTVIGHSLSKIFRFLGHPVERINHLGDYGTQFGKLIVAFRKWGSRAEVEQEPIRSLLAYYVKFHEEAEKDPALDDEARATFTRLEKGEAEETELWQWFRDESLKEFERVYQMMGIEFDSYAGESFYSDKMERILQMLRDKQLLVESEGAQIVDLEEYGMSPALIQKSDGSTLYITRDIAAAVYRKEHYDFYKNIYVVATQQNLHFQQWIKILELMGFDWANDCVHVPFGLVSLEEGTMSTRAGRVVYLEDVLNKAIERTREIVMEKNVNTDNVDNTARQVGIGAVVFNELANGRIKDYVFNWDKVLNFDGETGPYVQYTHARAASVLRNGDFRAETIKPADWPDDRFSTIIIDSAFELARLVYQFPEIVLDAADKYEPSIITRHIVDIAQAFNRFYHNEHILVEDAAEREAKLSLTYAAKQTIANGLALLGIAAPERM